MVQEPVHRREDGDGVNLKTGKFILMGLALLLSSLFVVTTAKYPVTSKTGEHACFTFAIADQDMPSGIYYDLQDDWPTGEALWLDVPVWFADGFLLMSAISVWWLVFKRRRDTRF
jgi:hypothetical protein